MPKRIRKSQELSYALTVKDAMKTQVVCVKPNDTIKKLRVILKENRISGAPVIERGKLLGIISLEDLINCLVKNEMNAKIKDKMTKNVVCCHPDDLLIKAIDVLEKTGFGRLPVVTRDNGELVGILTKSDIIMCLFKKIEELYELKEEEEEEKKSLLYKDLEGDFNLRVKEKVKKYDFTNAGKVSSKFRNILTKMGVPAEFTRRASICSYEAEMNMVIYSEGGTMELILNRDKIRLKAYDRGPGIEDLEKAMTPGYSTAPDWVRELGFGAGMGLPNIKYNSDKFTIDTKKNEYTRLNIEVNLP